MAAKLTVHNAEIKTASVEIKTLTIGGKQVTLAVFRQLREEPLINDDGTLNGVPWGTVNYHPDKCADRAEHWHVVWQRGSELLRSAVAVDPGFKDYQSGTGHRYLMACVWEHVNGGSRHFNNQPLISNPDSGRNARVRVIDLSGVQVLMAASPNAQRAVDEQDDLMRYRERVAKTGVKDGHADRLQRYENNLAYSVEVLKDEFEQYAITKTANELYEDLKAECRTEAERRQPHTQARQAIADLPQLFIAV